MEKIWSDMPALSILTALLLGALAFLFARRGPKVSRLLAVVAAGWVLAIGVYVVTCQFPFAALADLALGPITLPLQFASSPLGNVVALGAAFFTLLIAVYSIPVMAGSRFEGKYYAYLIWALAGACLVGWAGSFFVLLLGWELVTVMLFLLLNLGRTGAEAGAAKTYGVLGFADACLFLAVALMAGASYFAKHGLMGLSLDSFGVANPMFDLALPAHSQPLSVAALGPFGYAIYGLLLVAALAKAGAMPLHSWIPAAARTAPTPIMAYLPGAVDKLLGIYLLARVALDCFKPDAVMQGILMTVGAVTILAAVFMAMVQHNLKRLLSFHAVSQVGYMVLGIGTGTVVGVVGGLFHMVNHALYKSNLFLMSDQVGRAAGTDEIDDMGGLARQLPITFACGLVAAASISGVPPFNGFVSKWMVYQGTLELHSGWGALLLIVAVFGSALTLASFVKVLYAAFLSRRPVDAPPPSAHRETFWTAAPMIVLALACVVLGVWPQVMTGDVLSYGVLDNLRTTRSVINTEGGPSVTTAAYGVSLWQPSAALGLILLGMLLGAALLAVFSLKKVRVVRPFLSGEIGLGADRDRFRYGGGNFYETIRRLPGLGGLLAAGEAGAMDLYHWAGRYVGTVISVLRAQHTGLICLYVAWCVVGFAATLVYVLIAGHVAP